MYVSKTFIKVKRSVLCAEYLPMSSKFHLSKWRTYFSQFIDKFLKIELRGSGTDYSRKNFPGLIKNEVEFPRATKKKQCGISGGLCFWHWNFEGM